MTTAISGNDKVLIVTNGAYGERIVKMAHYIGLIMLNIVWPIMSIQRKMTLDVF